MRGNRSTRGAAYAGLAARILACRLGSTRPFKITLALTDRCDCRCEGCFIWRKPKGPEPSPEQIRGMLRRVPSLRWVNLTGGEPFLRDDLPRVAAAVKDALPRIAVLDVPTTGQRPERIAADMAEIVRLGIPRVYVTVSLEGPPGLHDRLRGRPGAFERMVRTYAALKRIVGVRVYLGMTLSTANADVVEEALGAVRRSLPADAGTVTWRDLHLNVFVRSDHYYANTDSTLGPPLLLPAAVARALRAREGSWDPTDRIESAYLRLLPAYLERGQSPLPCASLRAGVFVDAGGDVYPCTVWGRRLGNAFLAPLDEILDGDRARAARAAISRHACPGCWSPCEANPTIVAGVPESLLQGPRG